jgi:hypothetical protein
MRAYRAGDRVCISTCPLGKEMTILDPQGVPSDFTELVYRCESTHKRPFEQHVARIEENMIILAIGGSIDERRRAARPREGEAGR